MNTKLRGFLWIAFAVYCAVMCLFLFDRVPYDLGKPYWEELKWNLNLVPFRTIKDYLAVLIWHRNGYLVSNAFLNLAGNVAAFVPLGFFLPCLWKQLRSIQNLLLCSGAVILLVELIQLFTLRGCCDIDDFLLNFLGAALGFPLWKVLSRTLLKGAV